MKRLNFFLIITLIFAGLLINIKISDEKEQVSSTELQPKPSTHWEGWLDYKENITFSQAVTTNYDVDWSFTSSVGNIYINIIAMDEWNYTDFTTGGIGYSYWTIVPGSNSGSGEWDIPYDDTWYVTFRNNDDDEGSTYVTLDIDFIERSTNNGNGADDDKDGGNPFDMGQLTTILIIIGIAGGGGVAAFIIIKNVRSGPREKKVETKDYRTEESTKVQSRGAAIMLYCPGCNKPYESGAEFCPFCGKRF